MEHFTRQLSARFTYLFGKGNRTTMAHALGLYCLNQVLFYLFILVYCVCLLYTCLGEGVMW